MIIKELIEELKKYPSDMRVVIRGYEDGYNDIQDFKELLAAIDVNKKDYYGAHESILEGEIDKFDKVEKVLELYGENHLAEAE